MKSKHLYILLVSFVIMAFGLFLSFPFNNTFAAIGSFGTPFGGRVLFETPCTCGASTLIFVGPPVGGGFMLTPSSRVYEKYRPFPPNWVLGLADGFATCMELIITPLGPECIPIGGGPVIRIMGTS